MKKYFQKHHYFIFTLFLIMFGIGLLQIKYASATTIMENVNKPCQETGDCTIEDFWRILVFLFRWLFSIIGSLMLLMFVYGGFMMLVSGGTAETVTKGKNAITAAIVGTIIAFSSFLIVDNIFKGAGIQYTIEGRRWYFSDWFQEQTTRSDTDPNIVNPKINPTIENARPTETKRAEDIKTAFNRIDALNKSGKIRYDSDTNATCKENGKKTGVETNIKEIKNNNGYITRCDANCECGQDRPDGTPRQVQVDPKLLNTLANVVEELNNKNPRAQIVITSIATGKHDGHTVTKKWDVCGGESCHYAGKKIDIDVPDSERGFVTKQFRDAGCAVYTGHSTHLDIMCIDGRDDLDSVYK